MSRIFFVLILLLSPKAFAKDPPVESCGGFAQTVNNKLSFNRVEMVSRNHAVGLHREENLHLNPWIDVGPKAYLGLDQYGRAIQIVEVRDRTLAFLLSGERRLKDLFLHLPNQLMAIDSDGNLLDFQWTQWESSNLGEILKSSAGLSVAGACTAAFVSSLMTQLSGAPISSLENLLTIGVAGTAAVLIQVYAAMNRYGQQNDVTDGFAATNHTLPAYKSSDTVRSDDGQIIDYKIRTRFGDFSLLELLNGNPADLSTKGFQYTCEHELLPRGIPSRQYEPQL